MYYGNGYDGYSMSNNAREAYDNDEKPWSKWTKHDLLEQADYLLEDITPQFDRKKLEKLPVPVLRDILLEYSSWHHTSKYYNTTYFYEVAPSCVENLTDEKIESALKDYREKKKTSCEIKSYHGSIRYLKWSGTRAHPKAEEKSLDNVLIEEHGSYYVVKDEDGNEILRKKMYSTGTSVINHDEEKMKKETIRRGSSPEAFEMYLDLEKNGCSVSWSGHMYRSGRKPSREDYDAGLENFFTIGEKRLASNSDGGYTIEEWDGSGWR